MKYINNEDGFTLIEVVLSILILAIVSAIVIQLYITANEVSDHAKQTDWAVTQTSSAVEILEAYKDPYQAMAHSFFESADLEEGDGFKITSMIYYDEDLATTDVSNAVYTLTVQMLPKEPANIIGSDVTGSDQEQVNIMMIIDTQLKDSEDKVLSQHTLGHYYTFVR